MITSQIKFAVPALLFLLVGSGELSAQTPKEVGGGITAIEAPQGTIAPLFRVSGARASSTLTTAIHCSNNDSVPVSIFVTYFDYDNTYICGLTLSDKPVGFTSTFTTANTVVFDEDAICPGPPPALGQGRVEIGTYPYHAKITCSAQVVSVTGNSPTTLSSLDVFPAN